MKKLFFRIFAGFALIAVIFWIIGCDSAYYAIWEMLGKEKRHLLSDNVQEAQAEQTKASEQFKDALTRLKEMYGFQGGDLEEFYKKLNSDYELCEKRADDVSGRIKKVEEIASALFLEWENELNEISNQQLKTKSSEALETTRVRYKKLYDAMSKAESSMKPVLKNLNNYVLYLKHNLNAQAIGSLKREVDGIESDIEILVRDISKSVKEAEDFLKNIK